MSIKDIKKEGKKSLIIPAIWENSQKHLAARREWPLSAYLKAWEEMSVSLLMWKWGEGAWMQKSFEAMMIQPKKLHNGQTASFFFSSVNGRCFISVKRPTQPKITDRPFTLVPARLYLVFRIVHERFFIIYSVEVQKVLSCSTMIW